MSRRILAGLREGIVTFVPKDSSPAATGMAALLISIHTLAKLVQSGVLSEQAGREAIDMALLNAERAQHLADAGGSDHGTLRETRAILTATLNMLDAEGIGGGKRT